MNGVNVLPMFLDSKTLNNIDKQGLKENTNKESFSNALYRESWNDENDCCSNDINEEDLSKEMLPDSLRYALSNEELLAQQPVAETNELVITEFNEDRQLGLELQQHVLDEVNTTEQLSELLLSAGQFSQTDELHDLVELPVEHATLVGHVESYQEVMDAESIDIRNFILQLLSEQASVVEDEKVSKDWVITNKAFGIFMPGNNHTNMLGELVHSVNVKSAALHLVSEGMNSTEISAGINEGAAKQKSKLQHLRTLLSTIASQIKLANSKVVSEQKLGVERVDAKLLEGEVKKISSQNLTVLISKEEISLVIRDYKNAALEIMKSAKVLIESLNANAPIKKVVVNGKDLSEEFLSWR